MNNMVKIPLPFTPFRLGESLNGFMSQYQAVEFKWDELEREIINRLDLTHQDLLGFGIDYAVAHNDEPYRFRDKMEFYSDMIIKWEEKYMASIGNENINMMYRVSMVPMNDWLTILQHSPLFDDAKDATNWAQTQDVDWTKMTFRICMVFEEVLVGE